MTLYIQLYYILIFLQVEFKGETQSNITKKVNYWRDSFFSETVLFTLIFDMFPSLHRYLLGQAGNDIEQKW